MPCKNRVKDYLNGAIYHIYNRGLDGREIFKDDEDFEFFRTVLKKYLNTFSEEGDGRYKTDRPYIKRHKREMNLAGEIEMLAYCLMPDHYHLLVRQKQADGITKLMRRVMTNYVMYYNRKYKRNGNLFENIYRAVIVPEDIRLVELSKHIHLNPVARVVRRYGLVETISSSSPEYYMYSSYQEYVGGRQDGWVKCTRVLDILGKQMPEERDYRSFVEREDKNRQQAISNLILEAGR
jgi:putative transposase